MVMYAGKVVEAARREVALLQTHAPYTWGLLDSMPSLSSERKADLSTIPRDTALDLRLTGKACNFANRCPYAQDICSKEVPELVEVEPGHLVACHRQTLDTHLERAKGGK